MQFWVFKDRGSLPPSHPAQPRRQRSQPDKGGPSHNHRVRRRAEVGGNQAGCNNHPRPHQCGKDPTGVVLNLCFHKKQPSSCQSRQAVEAARVHSRFYYIISNFAVREGVAAARSGVEAEVGLAFGGFVGEAVDFGPGLDEGVVGKGIGGPVFAFAGVVETVGEFSGGLS